MVENRSFSSRLFDLFNILLLTALALVCLYPMWHVVAASISDPKMLSVHHGALLWPLGLSTAGYRVVLNNPNVWNGYANTLFYVTVGTLLRMASTILGAYVLSRRDFMFQRVMMFIVVFTMYFGGGMVPTFLVVKTLGLYNTRAALIIPSLIATWNMIILKTGIQSVPDSLEESARLDGAGDFVVLLQIILPVIKANLAVVALYYAVGEWNSWFKAVIYLQDKGKQPLQVFLREILITRSAETGISTGAVVAQINSSADVAGSAELFVQELIRYCTIVVATVPILCLYPFVQKYFVQGVMMGSIKG